MHGNGIRTPEIAARCFVAEMTVVNTTREARSRLGAKTITQAVATSIALELLALDHLGHVSVPEQQQLVAA
jgi:DNA-binding CsgD family transcriptional regulator